MRRVNKLQTKYSVKSPVRTKGFLSSIFLIPVSLLLMNEMVLAANTSADLAKALANPVADLASLPFQFNFDQDIGSDDNGERLTLNIQPVIPVSLNDDWLMISRTILPVITQSDVPTGEDLSGIGDITQSFFFSPKKNTSFGEKGQFIWGAGGAFLLPAGSDDKLSTKKWGAGPSVVGMVQEGAWTYGALLNHVWSFAGDDDRQDISQTYVNPFLTYITKDAISITPVADITYDWENEDWSIPVGLMFSKVFSMGAQPVSLAAGVRYWADSPDNGPEGWGGRITANFIFPKKK